MIVIATDFQDDSIGFLKKFCSRFKPGRNVFVDDKLIIFNVNNIFFEGARNSELRAVIRLMTKTPNNMISQINIQRNKIVVFDITPLGDLRINIVDVDVFASRCPW